MFEFFNVYLSSGIDMASEWKAGLDIGKKENGEKFASAGAKYKNGNIESSAEAVYNFNQKRLDANSGVGNTRFGGIRGRLGRTKEETIASVGLYGKARTWSPYATGAAAGFLSGSAAWDFYNASQAAPEPYKALGFAALVGGIVALAVGLLANFLKKDYTFAWKN